MNLGFVFFNLFNLNSHLLKVYSVTRRLRYLFYKTESVGNPILQVRARKPVEVV